jgi:RNA polymerase subunit RPABC4/transcription elongation factor Spt4
MTAGLAATCVTTHAGVRGTQGSNLMHVPCPRCERAIDDGAVNCPHCGAAAAKAPPTVTSCRQCGRAVPIEAAICSGCGVDAPGQVAKDRLVQEAAAVAADKEQYARRQALVGKLVLAGLGVVVAAIAFAAVTGGDEDGTQSRDSAEDREPPSEFGAEVACEEAVKDQLKSPSTADFSEQTRTKLSSDTFEVVGFVDSQNGFGATVRAAWSCTAKATAQGDGYSWTLLRPVEIAQR